MYYVSFVSSTDFLKTYFTLSDGVSNCSCGVSFLVENILSDEMEAAPVTVGQSKGRTGRIPSVSA